MIAAPIALTLVLGWMTFEQACPRHEDGIGYFYVLWTCFFAAPGTLLVGLGIAVRRVAVSAA